MEKSSKFGDVILDSIHAAVDLGHSMGTFVKNGELLQSQCVRCLCYLFVAVDTKAGTAEYKGTASWHSCDPNANDKTMVFEPMSDEEKAKISAKMKHIPWKHPAEK